MRLFIVLLAFAAVAAADRIPKAELRPLDPDRPQFTFSPNTIDKGWFQVEADILRYAKDNSIPGAPGIETNELALLAGRVRYGLNPKTEVAIGWTPYIRREVANASTSGIGDLYLAGKWNWFGNGDPRPDSAGAIVSIKLPFKKQELGGDRHITGAGFLTYHRDMSQGLVGFAMVGLDIARKDANNGYQLGLLGTIGVRKMIQKKFAPFFEMQVEVFTDSDWWGAFNLGLTYQYNNELMFDAGAILGFTRAAPDYALYIGATYRF
jgi:hypothetical protein